MRDWLARRWFDLAVLGGLVVLLLLVGHWRGQQYQGYGLKGHWYTNTDFKGKPFATTVDPVIDFSAERDHPQFSRPRFSVEWSGTIVLPRPGRYQFATESDDGSWLEINGDLIVNNGGVHGSQRRDGVRILPAGPHSIRVRYFQAGAGSGVRVFWKPCRRGVLEYIPPTLLFPTPPERVDKARAHAIPPRDLPSVVILGLGLVLACLIWGRGPLWSWLKDLRHRRWARIDLGLCLLLLAGALGFRLWELDAVGQTWDEDVYWSAGRNYIQNLLGFDFRAESWSWNLEHPALAKWLYGPATLLSPDFNYARLVATVAGALTCVLLFLVGRDLISRRVGFIGAALAAVLPHIVGHNRIIGLETPTGLFYLLTLWLFHRGLRKGGNTPFYLLAGLTTGLALATRLSNLSLLLLLLLLYVVAHWREIRETRALPVPLSLGLAPVMAGLVFVGLWPFLWDNPLGHTGQMLSHWKPDIFLEHFLGERQEPPPYYFPLYFLVTMPVALLPVTLVGLARTLVKRGQGHLTLLLFFVVPWVVVFSPMARDGVRYLFPALFAACLLAAAGADWIASGVAQLVRRPAVAAPLLAVLGVGIGMQTLHAGLLVHPYYIDYYNELTGGSEGAAKHRLFEIGWWGEGLKEATDFISRTAPHRAEVKIHAHPTHVVHLRPDIQLVDHMNADFVIFNNLFNNPVQLPQHRVAYVVRAAGAPLVWVYQKENP